MPTPLKLEEFDLGQMKGPSKQSFSEADRQSAFEQGYQSGWDDNATEVANAARALSNDLVQNLRDLAFTYHEAKDHTLRSLEPLICDIVGKVLPEIAQSTLPRIVAERVDALAREQLNEPLELAVCALDHDTVQALLPTTTQFPLTLIDDPAMDRGQVRLRSGARGCDIDMPTLLFDIQRAVDDFFTLTTRKQANG